MIVDFLFIAAAIAILIAIYKLKFSKENISKEIQQATEKYKEDQTEEVEKEEIKTGLASAGSSGWSNDQQDSDQEEEVDMKKKLRKQQKQKQKQERKQAQEYYLEQEREKREKYDKEMEERERMEEEKKQKEEEIIAQLKQEERKRKQQQFNKWKDMFKVEAEGKDKLSQEQEKRKAEEFNSKLITLLKKHKLTLLEDLSHRFKMSTKEVVDKIKQLQGQGLISGIFDERGKYLMIQHNEWEAIKNYISVRGRVKKTDIMTECARLIKIPDEVQSDLLTLVEEEGKS